MTKWEGKSLVGGRLGQFDVKDEIARGGMGVVYKGYQPSLDRWVAIKTLPLDLASDRDLVARFQREAEAMVRLNHANIVQIIDRGEDAGQYYFAMEFVEGPSVKDLLKLETIDTDRLFDILIQTCEGLDYAHKKGLVHRDIKPANLLFEEKTGTVKIADFGIAHFSKKDEDMLTLTADNVGMGTMNYMSPEQKVNAKNVDHRADIYAVGVIIYEAFTGKLPLGKFKLPSEVNPKLPRALDAIVQKCLEAEPADRFESCASLKASLIEAKAATHDKTIARAVKEWGDRTLTVFGPNKKVGCTVVVLILLGFMGVVATVALLAWKARSASNRIAAAIAAADTARDRAVKLGCEHAAGKASFDDGESDKRRAEDATGDLKAQELETAATSYRRAADAAIDARKTEADALLARLAKQREHASHASNALARAAAAKIDAAEKQAKQVRDAISAISEKPDAPVEGLDLTQANASAASADTDLSQSDTTETALASVEEKLKTVKNDDPRYAEIQAAIKQAREATDPAAATNARDKATTLVAEATNTTPVAIPSPSPVPTSGPQPSPVATGMDPALVQGLLEANSAVNDAQRDAESVFKYSTKLKLDAGKAELDEARKARESEKEIKQAQSKIDALNAAAKGFKKARDKALKAIDDRRAAARENAKPAAALDEYRRALALESDIQGASGEDAAKLRADQIAAFDAALDKWRERGSTVAKEKQAIAEKARDNALLRVATGTDPHLDEGNKHFQKGRETLEKLPGSPDAANEFELAANEFQRADFPLPKSATFDSANFEVAPAKNIGFATGIQVIAAVPAGVVIAVDDRLSCFKFVGKELKRVVPDCTLAGNVLALCAGEGNDVFASLSNNTIVHCPIDVPNATLDAKGDPLKLKRGAFGLAYERERGWIYAATDADVSAYQFETASRQDSPKSTRTIRFPESFHVRSMAVLADRSLVCAGNLQTFGKAEDEWAFVVQRFDEMGSLAERNANDSPGFPAIAAAGAGLVAIDHAGTGKLWKWTSAGAIKDLPNQILDDGEKIKPKHALRLAVSAGRAWVLDLSGTDAGVADSGPVARWRLISYQLKP